MVPWHFGRMDGYLACARCSDSLLGRLHLRRPLTLMYLADRIQGPSGKGGMTLTPVKDACRMELDSGEGMYVGWTTCRYQFHRNWPQKGLYGALDCFCFPSAMCDLESSETRPSGHLQEREGSSFISVAMLKYPDQNQLREKGVNLANNFSVEVKQ